MPATRLTMAVIQVLVLWRITRIGPLAMLGNLRWVFIAAVAAMVPGVFATALSSSPAIAAGSAVLSIVIYLAFVLVQPDLREMTLALLRRLGLSKLIPNRKATK